MDKNTYIANKVKKLMNEGKSQAQSLAISYSMYEIEKDKMQEGGKSSPTNVNSHYKNIDYIQTGVSNGKLGDGVYLYTSDGKREFVTDNEFRNTVQKSTPYKNYIASVGNIGRHIPGTENKTYTPIDMSSSPTTSINSHYKPLYNIQSGVYNNKLGEGMYFQYKDPSAPDYNYETDRDFVSNDAWNSGIRNAKNVQEFYQRKQISQKPIFENLPKTQPALAQTPYQNGGYTENEQAFLEAYKYGGGTDLPEYKYAGFTLPNLQSQFISPLQDFSAQNNEAITANPNNSASFYKGMFSQRPFIPDAELGFNIGEQYYGLGRDKNYVNPLSEKSLTAGEDWKNANPLPQGVFEKDLGYESDLNYTGQNSNKSKQYNDFVKYKILNPYGGVDLESRLQYGLYNFGAGDNAKGALGLAGFGLGALRVGLSGYGAGKNDRQVWENYQDQQYNQPPIYERQQEGGYVDFMKEGGKTIADMMTGNYIAEDPNPNAPKNVEVEDGEYIKNSQTQEVVEAVGEKHKNGGVKVNLPAESKVLSDFTKIGASNVKKLKEQFDVKIKPTDTFSDVLDKYKKKIGAKELEEEEVEYMKEIEKQLKANISEKTKQINLDFLGKELEEVQSKKTEMQKKIDEAFEILFNEQEKLPKKNSSPMMQEGGNIPPEIAQLAEQYGIPVEKAMELIAQQQGQEQSGDIMQQVMSMLQQGVQPEQIIQELVSAGYPQEEAVAIIEQVMAQGQPQQEVPVNEEGMPMAQEGLKTISDWTKSQMYKAEYELGDVAQTAERFKELADNVGLKYTADDFKDMNSLNKFAGKLQQKVIKDKPELAYNYGLSVEPTRQGLQYLVDNKLINPKELGIKIQDGKVARGSYDTLNEDALNKISTIIQSLPENNKNEYALKNYNDNLAYFRGIKYKDFNLSKDEFDKYLNENKDKLVGNSGYYKTEVPGVYVKPNLQTPNGEVKPEEKTLDINLQNNQPINRQVTKNIVPLLPYFPQLPPNSMQIPKRQQVDLSRIEPVKIGVEPNLAEAERARIARAMSYANLSPEVASAMQSADLMATQQANNQAISAMEVANAQAQFQADQFNAQQRDREQLTNLGLDKRYEQEMLASLNNQDRDWRTYYGAEARQQKANYDTIVETNLFNAMNPNYNMNLGTGQVDFLNPYMFSNNQNQENKELQKLMGSTKTPEERNQLIKLLTEYNKSRNSIS